MATKAAKKKAPAKKAVTKAVKAVKKTVKPVKEVVKAEKAVKKTVKAVKKVKTARKPNPAFMKPLTPDAALAEIVGAKPLPRTEITKKLWAYIKKNGLQDKVNKREINADDKLKVVFGGKKKVNMFEMTKLVSVHIQ